MIRNVCKIIIENFLESKFHPFTWISQKKNVKHYRTYFFREIKIRKIMKYFIFTLKMEGKKIARNPLNKKPPLEFIQVDCADIVLFLQDASCLLYLWIYDVI